MRLCVFCTALLFVAAATAQRKAACPCEFGAATGAEAPTEHRRIRTGTVKSFTPGREITIDLPMAFDKSYDLAHPSPDVRVRIAGHIAPGEPVAVIEYDEAGKHCVDIVPEADFSDDFKPSTAAGGEVTDYIPGERITVLLNGGGIRKFDLRARGGVHVVVADGISRGDAVCIFEGERRKRRVVRIEKTTQSRPGLPPPADRRTK